MATMSDQTSPEPLTGIFTPEQRRALFRNTNVDGNQKPIDIFTYGGGAVGALYSWIISLGSRPVNFTMACRSNYSMVQSSGFTIDSTLFGPGQFRPQKVIRDVFEVACPNDPTKSIVEYDLVFVCTKASGKVDIPAHIVTPGKTAIILFQNGINIEAPYKEAFPLNPVISAVLYISCSQPVPGKIVHVGDIDIVKLGLYPDLPAREPTHPSLQLISDLLQGGGCNAAAIPHIQSYRWLKTVYNGCWNVLCAVSGLDTHAFLASSPRAREAARALSQELIAVAKRALGILGADGQLASEGEGEGKVAKEALMLWSSEAATAGWNIALAERLVPITPSMLEDARKGMEMEVEAFCGEVVRTGERLGVELPVLKALYPILQAMNYRFKQARV
ncbi:6-phosphogluconate dehydrogenase C-terminal domain-like protein [Terfezia boudieri ATCC MYA-4762]|uniref:6-phosphogluconate dehydrogenase C-terminal domain-like protein n=1 Tax=Terfezia boudieri ATCC MYA-4762 TaxID=1051890 RepID=A0A3N4LCS8_9PEZI|nr:6-phosphogluconate dehydrogenase C-terminal domain-like protein [Terfezia boudieri ATCC MYA-4762]